MPSSASSNSTEVITNVVFGFTATVISVVTVWQGHRVWKMWREHSHHQENVAPDIELGLHSPQSTPTSLEAPERGEVVAASASSSDHVEDVTGSEHMHVSIPDPHLQFTPPTTVADETNFSPALAQGTQTENDEHPKVHTGNAQPASTDSERLELRPAPNDDI